MFDSLVVAPPEDAPLSRCRPSGWLALELDSSTVVSSTVDDADLVEAIIAFERVASWAAARQARVLAEFARRRPASDDPSAARSAVASVASEFAPDEVGLALRLSRVAAGARLEQAVTLVRVLPEVLTAWEHGELDATKVRAIVEACRPLRPEHARVVAERVLPGAGEQTAGALRSALARAVIAVDPDGAAERHREVRRERRVVFNPEPEGMASLSGLLPAPDAVAAYQHLGALARAMSAADPRGMDARRADLMADLLTGRRCALTHPLAAGCAIDDTDGGPVDAGPTGEAPPGTAPADGSPTDGSATDGSAGAHSSADPSPVDGPSSDSSAGDDSPANGSATDGADADGARQSTGQHGRRPNPPRPSAPARIRAPTVHVTVPITMLLGLDQAPGELRGYGSIPAALAREIAARGTWRRLLTDPESGTLLDHGRTTYTPPAGLADHIRARDAECRSPICRRTATEADLDHTIAWNDGGTTSEHNLHARCRHDHRLKTHAPDWTVIQSPDGTITYITPTRHRYTSQPHDYRSDPQPDHDLHTGQAPPVAETDQPPDQPPF
jgi:hypothetical protein